jgi:hypothetical protein
MGNQEFVTFRRFAGKPQAELLMSLLGKNDIEALLEDNTSSLDSNFGSHAFENNYAVKLRQHDFENANRILIEDSISDLDSIDKDYYLFGFTDEELREVIAHSDEWNPFDFLLAQKLLKERGHEIKQEEVEAIKERRIMELSQPEPSQTLSIFAGYFFAIVGGLFGILIGWFLSSHKKTLPNGDRVYAYNTNDRKHGRNILYLGIFVLILGYYIKAFNLFAIFPE